MFVFMLVGCIDYGFVEPSLETNDVIPADTAEEYDPVPVADAPVYANSSDALYKVEPDTGAAHFVANFWNEDGAIRNVVDIAIDLDGRMYGGTYDSLYRIDPTNGHVTEICLSPAEMTALAFTSEGTLVAGGDDRITLLNVDNCQAEILLSNSFWKTSGDLVGLPDGFLYWTVVGENGGDELVKLDPHTGMTQWIGKIGHSGLYGLGYDDGELFGFAASGTIVAISPEKANSSVLRDAGDVSWWGATTNPVIW